MKNAFDLRWLPTLSTCVLLLCSTSVLGADELDTTRVREVAKPKKSFGQVMTEVPGEIVKLPIHTVQFVSHTIAFNPPVSWGTTLIRIGEEARPYLPVAGYSSRAGLKFGFALRKLKNIGPTDHLKGKWYYSTKDYQSYKLQMRFETLLTDWLGLDLYFRYKKRPRENFYGVGNGSREDKEANYTLENTEFKVEVPFHTHERVYLSALGRYLVTNLTDGKDPDLVGHLDSIFADPDFALEEGRLDGSRYVALGTQFEYDGRNNRGQPSQGSHVIAQFSRYFGTGVSDGQDFNEYTLDFRHYQHIWLKRILAVRFYVKRFDANDANTLATPIHMTSSLGGIDALRGYSRGRFIDNDVAVASIEYRYPIWDMADAFVFIDEGRVFEKMTDEEFFSDWKYSAGFGIRVWSFEDILAMFQVARSDEASRIYFELGASW